MLKIEEDFITTILAENLNFQTSPTYDRIIISNLILSDESAATLAWLVNKAQGTKLELQIKLKNDS
jgi:hypothetical protein